MSPCTFLLVFLLFFCITGLGRAYSAQRSIEHHNGVTKRRLPHSAGLEKSVSAVQYKNVPFSARATGPFAVQQSQTGPNFVQLTSTSQVPRRRRRQRERNVNSEEPPMRSGNRHWGWLSPRAWLRGAANRLGRGTNSRRCNESPEIVLPPGIAVIATLLQQLREEIEGFSVQQRDNPQLERTAELFFPPGITKTVVSKACGDQRNIKYDGIISSGTWSTVLRVIDTGEKKQYALKVRRLRGALSLESGYRSILEEGRIYRRCKPFGRSAAHAFRRLKLMVALDILRLEGVRSFVKRSDFRQTIANLFLLMPLAKTDLLSFLQALFSRPPISESPSGFQARLKITAEAVTIVANLHKQRLVHGDIQPQKMLIMPNGSVVLGGILDFRRSGRRCSPDLLAVPYLPPELLDEECVYSYLTDSWQLGLTLYQIWCLRLPFGLMTPVVADDPDYYVVEEVLRKPDAELSFEQAGCVANIPEYVESLIKQLLQFNPENRLTPARILVSRDFNRLGAHVDHLERSARELVGSPPPQGPRRVGWGLSGLQDGTELQSNNTNLESQN
uniref:WGS project CADU00000000 data, contig 00001328 n=1 Tax=Neospora caninum (strain Liverpool) TaxID=572307 RepID=F0JAV2_NEOCL|nr:unnamed protein product [Neospora caninum Liverpool]CEL71218.1 TPA: hypothetical protein BN1204_068850 [Neospora caninum Liverpool]